MVYLDHAAATEALPEAREAYEKALNCFGNPSSSHPAGKKASALLEEARESVAFAMDVPKECVFFTSGGTEANNIAVLGASGNRGHIVSTTLEHSSVTQTLTALKSKGREITLISPEKDGRIDVNNLVSAIREDTVLISCTLVCGETGASCDVNSIKTLAGNSIKPGKTLIHADAAQAFMHLPFSLENIDILTISAHKTGGVPGAGAVYIKPGVRLSPLMFGGAQEKGLRPGTEALPAIYAFGAAVKAFKAPNYSIKEYAVNMLSRLGAFIIPSSDTNHIVSFSLEGPPGEVLARMLGDMNICVSSGSACHKGKKSPALASLKLPNSIKDSIIRISFSNKTSQEDIDALEKALLQIMESNPVFMK